MSDDEREATPTVDPPAFPADDRLVAAVDFARSALADNAPSSAVGGHLGFDVHGEHVVTHYFECLQSGYPGWRWSVTVARADGDSEPTLVESELVSGEGALLAPEWVPWSERLAEYQAQQAAEKADDADASDGSDEDSDDDLDDVDEDDLDDDLDDELDGVDIDDDDEPDDDDSDSDDSDDEPGDSER